MKYLVFIMATVLFIACSKGDDDSTPATTNPTTQSTIEDKMESGSWKITNFNEDGRDETNHFTGYTFSFKEDGTLTASNGTNNYNGTWSITDSNSSDDSPDDLHFNIMFSSPDDFTDLNDDWEILSNTGNKIELRDVSGGNGGTDLLTFEKN